jgi:hypothetical protein
MGLLVLEPPFFKGGQWGFVFSWFGQVHDPMFLQQLLIITSMMATWYEL